MSQSAATTRNVAFVGHPSAGKTTLIDALAFSLGAADRKGSVADKSSIADTEPEEQDKGHTLVAKVLHVSKDGRDWNLFDTPGYPDFVAETTGAMFGSDLTVGVVSCSSGVTFNLRKKMELATELGRGRAVVLTHLDGDNADFEATVAALRDEVSRACVPVQLPNASGSGFASIESVLTGASDWRKRLMDRVMDACEDEDVVMRYLEEETLSDEVLHANVPNAISKGTLVPVLVCNPVSGLGVDELVAFLAEYAPTADTEGLFKSNGEPVPCTPEGPAVGVVVGVRSDPHVGRVCIARLLQGSLGAHDALIPARDPDAKSEKTGGLFHQVGGKRRDPIERGGAGDVVAFTKVEKINWGDTFTVAGHKAPVVDRPEIPPPMVSLAVVPKSRSDEQKIGESLAKLSAEDPSLEIEQDPVTHELVLHGMSDLHLQVIEARLKRRYGVEIDTGLPRIAFRETVTKPADGHHRHRKQSGGRGQFGECYLRVRPGEKDTGVVFLDKVVGGSIPRNLIPAVEKGIREICAEGVLTHSSVVDVEVELYDGKFHAVDSDEASFRKAGARAFRDGFGKAAPVLLEPIMEAVISIPSDDAGSVFSDLTSQRRGHVLDQQSDGTDTVIKAHVPLSTMQTYFRDLKSQTAGEGTYTMVLDHYAPMPTSEQQKVLAAIGKKHAEED